MRRKALAIVETSIRSHGSDSYATTDSPKTSTPDTPIAN